MSDFEAADDLAELHRAVHESIEAFNTYAQEGDAETFIAAMAKRGWTIRRTDDDAKTDRKP